MTKFKVFIISILVSFITRELNAQQPQPSFIDTLNKYKGVDTLLKNNKLMYIGTLHSKPFGLIQTSDTCFTLFQKNYQRWQITERLTLADITHVTYKDLDGDGLKDVIIVQDYTAAGANSENIVLLYNHKTGLVRHNASYDLPNIQYDKTKNLIYSSWFGSANHPQEKMVYKISGNGLAFYRGVKYIPDDQTKKGIINFYKEVKHKRVLIKTIKGGAEELFTIFRKTFWDTEN